MRVDEAANAPARREDLTEAFEWFVQTTERFQQSYRELQALVRTLSDELKSKNAELEESLKEKTRAENFLATILEHLTNGVVVLDGEGRPILVNPKAATLLEHAPLDRGEAALVRSLSASDPEGDRADYEARVPASEGGVRTLRVATAEVPRTDGNDACRLLVLEDVTWRKTLEAKLERTGRLAAMGEMASTIAHEVRNPLGSMELFASMLADDLKDRPEQLRLAERVSDGVKRLDRVVGNLLRFTQSPKPRLADADLTAIVESALGFVVHLAEMARVRIERVWPEGPALARVDGDLIGQVIMNLVVNGIQAMEESGGRLRVEIRRAEPVRGAGKVFGAAQRPWMVLVEDTGKGMTAEARAKIFDPFYTTKRHGTGLGLAISDRIVSAHDGFIGVESEPGAGTCFTLYLPEAATASDGGARAEAA